MTKAGMLGSKPFHLNEEAVLIRALPGLVSPSRQRKPDTSAGGGKIAPSLEQLSNHCTLLRRAHHFFELMKRKSSISIACSPIFFFSLLFSSRRRFNSLA